jgi:AraC-like DNA-binding protein
VPETETLSDRVRALVVNATKGGDPSLAAIAARLRVHPRVLQRRLRREGTSHQQILDEVRRRVAAELMERSDMAICEVAYLLGYADPSAFHRAFKRWTGSTPVTARRQRAQRA